MRQNQDDFILSHELESERARKASKASSAEWANEWEVQKTEQTDERVAQYLRLDSWLFWTIVTGLWRFLGREADDLSRRFRARLSANGDGLTQIESESGEN